LLVLNKALLVRLRDHPFNLEKKRAGKFIRIKESLLFISGRLLLSLRLG
jgi:hypothetical protein